MPRRSSAPAVSSAALDTLTLGTLTRIVPRATVAQVLRQHQRMHKIDCKLPAPFLVYVVIALGLQMALPTREVLRWLQQGMRALWGAAAVPAAVAGKAAISMARARLGWEVLRDVYAACVRPLATARTRGAWYRGLRLVAVDGSSLAVPDTPSNTAAFGKAASNDGPSAFPLLRVVSLVEVGTHAILAAALGRWRDAELTLAATLVGHLHAGLLCLLDRGFVGYPFWQQVAATGADLLCRLRVNLDLPVDERLPDGSYLSTLYPSPRDRRAGTRGIRIRVIDYTLPGVPDAEPLYRLGTTLLDPAQAPAADLAALYHERWEHESVLDEVKTHLHGGSAAVLRSLTADRVRQELYGLLLAHYVVRGVMHDAALQADEDPDRLSFTHTVHVLRRTLPQAAALPPSPVVTLV
ncbi:MAG: IS4 family transposase [Armatimonadota bacterium]